MQARQREFRRSLGRRGFNPTPLFVSVLGSRCSDCGCRVRRHGSRAAVAAAAAAASAGRTTTGTAGGGGIWTSAAYGSSCGMTCGARPAPAAGFAPSWCRGLRPTRCTRAPSRTRSRISRSHGQERHRRSDGHHVVHGRQHRAARACRRAGRTLRGGAHTAMSRWCSGLPTASGRRHWPHRRSGPGTGTSDTCRSPTSSAQLSVPSGASTFWIRPVVTTTHVNSRRLSPHPRKRRYE